eukprot:GHVS01071092.1.p1 GENE.GHVS01071092.1~~GHVS01071092.1.p1  ORF type:complete len:220 (-),score=14.01 GHVS01071092.1:224-799(-)
MALVNQTVRGASNYHNRVEGLLTGFRVGVILLIIYSLGGLFQSASHLLNVCHKLMGGSRPRPYGVLDAIWKGFNGFLLDTFWRPWVAVIVEPYNSIDRGDSCFITTSVLVGCALRCLFCPIFGLLNGAASITEGFANTLIGDFEQFTRVQERAEFDKKSRSHGRYPREERKEGGRGGGKVLGNRTASRRGS